ncbi:DUF1648 domain-containing protein [Nonomuraea maheshkhaliensis]|uniref:DUF1648 domain-containing protein n=1 Tax=Nonomuraea maheshkhaliensis TaxID=419590 RepID=A0ABN2HTM5_9ACTN
MRPRAVALVWGAAVTAVLILAPLALRDRLPDPLATHWGSSGSVPDGSTSFTAHVVTTSALWVVPWLLLVVFAGRAGARRGTRVTWWGLLFGLGALLLGAAASTLSVNLDAPGWRAAELPGWHVPLVILGLIVAGTAAGYLGRGPRDEPSPGEQAPPRLRLGPGQRAVWVSRIVNPWLAALTLCALAVIVVTTALTVSGVSGVSGVAGVGAALPAFVIVLVVGLATMALTVKVIDEKVVIGFGPFGRPARTIPLAKVESAWAEELRPSEVGGWGFRGLPGNAAIMLRGGECLVLRYRSGGRLAISIDDAERGASLINTLIAERVTS